MFFLGAQAYAKGKRVFVCTISAISWKILLEAEMFMAVLLHVTLPTPNRIVCVFNLFVKNVNSKIPGGN